MWHKLECCMVARTTTPNPLMYNPFSADWHCAHQAAAVLESTKQRNAAGCLPSEEAVQIESDCCEVGSAPECMRVCVQHSSVVLLRPSTEKPNERQNCSHSARRWFQLAAPGVNALIPHSRLLVALAFLRVDLWYGGVRTKSPTQTS